MATPSKTKSHFEQLLSEIYARRPHKNNQKVYKDCLKPSSNKNKFECKIRLDVKIRCCTRFYALDYQNSLLEILSSL